jgi:hypothetical protein
MSIFTAVSITSWLTLPGALTRRGPPNVLGPHRRAVPAAQSLAWSPVRSSYRFMTAMAGDRPNYEEAIRALFTNEAARFNELIAGWPVDVRDCTLMLAGNAFHQQPKVGSS